MRTGTWSWLTCKGPDEGIQLARARALGVMLYAAARLSSVSPGWTLMTDQPEGYWQACVEVALAVGVALGMDVSTGVLVSVGVVVFEGVLVKVAVPVGVVVGVWTCVGVSDVTPVGRGVHVMN
jgi:hypothetical protein